jgi:hypothetical protein
MCQSRHPRSQNPARHLADKIGYPPKNLPWTDKFCHFVMFAAEVVSHRAIPRSQFSYKNTEVSSVVSCASGENTQRRLCHAPVSSSSSSSSNLKFAFCNSQFAMSLLIQLTALMRHAEQQLTAI